MLGEGVRGSPWPLGSAGMLPTALSAENARFSCRVSVVCDNFRFRMQLTELRQRPGDVLLAPGHPPDTPHTWLGRLGSEERAYQAVLPPPLLPNKV